MGVEGRPIGAAMQRRPVTGVLNFASVAKILKWLCNVNINTSVIQHYMMCDTFLCFT